MTDPRFPLGEFHHPGEITPEQRAAWIAEVESLPGRMRAAVAGLSDPQLDTPYRDGGWTVRQLVHHVPDSHLNAYVRFKLALTEESPTIKPYDQDGWAALPDSRTTPPEVSLTLLEAVHRRWVEVLRGMSEADFSRAFVHPEMSHPVRLDESLGRYAWHCGHHLAHITALRERLGWDAR